MNLTLQGKKPRILALTSQNVLLTPFHVAAVDLPSCLVHSFDQLGRHDCSRGPAGSTGSCDSPWVPEIHFLKSCQKYPKISKNNQLEVQVLLAILGS